MTYAAPVALLNLKNQQFSQISFFRIDGHVKFYSNLNHAWILNQGVRPHPLASQPRWQPEVVVSEIFFFIQGFGLASEFGLVWNSALRA